MTGLQSQLTKIGSRVEQCAFREALHKSGLTNSKIARMYGKAEERHDAVDRELSKQQKQKRGYTWFNPRFESVKALARQEGFNWTPWTDKIRAEVAGELRSVVLEHIDLFVEDEEKSRKRGWKHKIYLVLSDRAKLETEQGVCDRRFQSPVHQVLTKRPQHWGPWINAPYPDDQAMLNDQTPLVRKAGAQQQKLIDEALRNGEMSVVVEAVNALMDVKYVMNQQVWEAVQWCVDNELEPDDSFWPLVELPQVARAAANDNGDDEGTDADELLLNKIQRGEIIKHNRAVRSAVIMRSYLQQTMDILGGSTFHIPHNLDFRSRIYPIPVVNHYDANHIKALFYFADGKPLGEAGLAWLYIHTATVADFTDDQGRRLSKLPVMDRIKWVEANLDHLLAVGRDFRSHYEYWSGADKKFEFLAACFELVKVDEHGIDYPSGLSVSIDGSCSGYQHMSMAMRAPKEAGLVNLVPSKAPNDIYQYIADKVKEVVAADVAADVSDGCECETPDVLECQVCRTRVAKQWTEYGITRKTVNAEL